MSIVRMLTATIVGRTLDAERVLAAIQSAGLLHVTPMRPPGGLREALRGGDEVLREVAQLRAAREAITQVAAVDTGQAPPDLDGAVATALAAHTERERLAAALATAEATASLLEPFGEFDPADIELIGRHNAPIVFARLTWNDYKALAIEQVPHCVCRESDVELHVALIGPEGLKVPTTPLRLPATRLSQVLREVGHLQAQLRAIEHTLGALAGAVPSIDDRLAELADREAVLMVLGGGLDEGEVFAVRGYVPAENQVDLQRAVSPFQVMLLIDDAAPGDDVPVLLQQPAAVAGFATIVRAFSGMSYWEKDFTPVVLVLFLLFGSLCLLDAGYGVFLTATGAWLWRRGTRDFGGVFALCGLFSIIVGALGGQYFGLLLGKDFWVGQQPPTPIAVDPMACLVFSLVVGLIAMTGAYLTAIWQRGWKTSATGSLLLALGSGALATASFAAAPLLRLVVADPTDALVAETAQGLTVFGKVLVGAGVASWFLYPDATFGDDKRVANFAWQFYSGVAGLGQDVMSHMRLFGISLSGAIMAVVVNEIAVLMPTIPMLIFAAVGHFFVYVLSLLSLYIHTNRLIFLEFGSKCFQGGHSWYSPLQRVGARAANPVGAAS